MIYLLSSYNIDLLFDIEKLKNNNFKSIKFDDVELFSIKELSKLIMNY